MSSQTLMNEFTSRIVRFLDELPDPLLFGAIFSNQTGNTLRKPSAFPFRVVRVSQENFQSEDVIEKHLLCHKARFRGCLFLYELFAGVIIESITATNLQLRKKLCPIANEARR